MKQNKITLDKTKVYDISELNEEQIKQVAEATGNWGEDYLECQKDMELCYDTNFNEWVLDAYKSHNNLPKSENLINAKTLFED